MKLKLFFILGSLVALASLGYAVDLARGVFYAGGPDGAKTVLADPLVNIAVMGGEFALFLFVGTFLFVRHERNR